MGDYRISIPVVAKMFNLEPSVVKTLFYEPGAMIQTVSDFDMDKRKQSHADNLLRATEEYQKAGSDFNAAKNAVLEIAKGMRTKNPQHRKTILDIVTQAQGYDQLRGGLLQAKLSFEGMGTRQPAVASTPPRHASITLVIPWTAQKTIRAAQKAAKLGKVQVHGSTKGFEIKGTVHHLADLGVVKQGDARNLLGNVRQAGVTTMEGRVWTFPEGKKAVEILARLPGKIAGLLARQLVSNRDFVFATVYDQTGKPHTIVAGTKDLLPGGAADGVGKDKFDPYELGMGTQHELEHTDKPDLAQEIAEDHLMEDPKYYERLLKLEARRIGCPLDSFKKEFAEEIQEFSSKIDQRTYEENEDDFHNLIDNLRLFNEGYQASRQRVKMETSEKISPQRVAKGNDPLIGDLKKVWETLSEDLADALDNDAFESPTIQEFVGDNAGHLLEGKSLKQWNDLDAEGKAKVLTEAFPSNNPYQVRNQTSVLRDKYRGASKIGCGCDHSDPTDVLDEDFVSPYQEMLLEPSSDFQDPNLIIIEIPD
jgi:hypothetical protein